MRRAILSASNESYDARALCERLRELWWRLPASYKRELYAEFALPVTHKDPTTPLWYPLQLAIERHAYALRTCVHYELRRAHTMVLADVHEAYRELNIQWLNVPRRGGMHKFVLGMALLDLSDVPASVGGGALPRLRWYSPEFCDMLIFYSAPTSPMVLRSISRN